jgi:hypothetical protein
MIATGCSLAYLPYPQQKFLSQMRQIIRLSMRKISALDLRSRLKELIGSVRLCECAQSGSLA